MCIELYDVDWQDGTANVGITDGDNWVGVEVSFCAISRYVDDSFSHAFGVHECGHWEIDIDDVAVRIIDSDGDVAIDENAILNLLETFALDVEFDDAAALPKARYLRRQLGETA